MKNMTSHHYIGNPDACKLLQCARKQQKHNKSKLQKLFKYNLSSHFKNGNLKDFKSLKLF